MKKKITFLLFVAYFASHGQTNSFEIKNCGSTYNVKYLTEADDDFKLVFSWKSEKSIILNKNNNYEKLTDIKGKDTLISKTKLIQFIKKDLGYNYFLNDLTDVRFKDKTKQVLEYSILKEYSKNQIKKDSEDEVFDSIYEALKSEDDKLKTCSKKDFKESLVKGITDLKDKIFKHITSLNSFNNKEIIFAKDSVKTKFLFIKTGEKSVQYYHKKDIRNPIAFTVFIVRNPRTNGTDKLTKLSNLSSYHYIKPGSIINIVFDDKVYNKLNNSNITITAYLKRKSGTIVPVTVSGFYEVKINSNQSDYERNITYKNSKNEDNNLNYEYKILNHKSTPIQTEVNTSMVNPQPEDLLIITVTNVSDGNVSYTTTFEFEEFGWITQPSGGFSWIKTLNEGTEFRPAGTSGVSFYYKFDKGAKFVNHFFVPSFGPELLVFQDNDNSQATNVALGVSLSTFLRTVKFGGGWYLVGEKGKPYFSIGVNFVEGYKTISSILKNSRE